MSQDLICIAGKNQIAVDFLFSLVHHGVKSRLVVCPNDSDNGQLSWQPSLRRAASKLSIEIVSIQDLYDIDRLILLSLEFNKILNPSLFKSSRLYNLHFSDLPRYKGMFTSCLPILHDQKYGGVTLHEIDDGIDTGPIVDQKILNLKTIGPLGIFTIVICAMDLYCFKITLVGYLVILSHLFPHLNHLNLFLLFEEFNRLFKPVY